MVRLTSLGCQYDCPLDDNVKGQFDQFDSQFSQFDETTCQLRRFPNLFLKDCKVYM